MGKKRVVLTVSIVMLVVLGMNVIPVRTTGQADDAGGEVLYIAMQEDMPNFNPFDLDSNTVWKNYVIGWAYDSLSGLDPGGNIYPALAESWEFDETNMTVTVQLREDVLFHDGEEMTADDVMFSYYSLRGLTTVGSSITDAFDADGDGMTSLDEINGTIDSDGDSNYEGITKLGDYSVKMVMAKPYGQFFHSTLGVTIIPMHIWKDHMSDDKAYYESDGVDVLWNTNKDATIGTGPFYYQSGEKDVYRIMKRYDDYWGKDFVTPDGHRIWPVNVNGIHFKLYSSLDTAILALKSGEVDHLPWAITPGHVPDITADPRTDAHFLADNGYRYLAFNQKRRPMNELPFRKAVSYCIDKNTIVQRYMGGYGRMGDSCEPPYWTDWYNASVAHYTYNLNMAKQVLEEAGYTGVGTSLKFPSGETVPPLVILTPPADYDPIRIKAGELIAKNLRSLGVDVVAKPMDFDALCAKMNALDYDMLIIGWSLSSDPVGNVFDILGPKAAQNTFSFWSENNDNPYYNEIGGVSTLADAETQALADQVAELGELAKGTFDRSEQIKYTKWAQGVVSEAIPVNVLYYTVNIFATSARWQGWIPFFGEVFNGYSVANLERHEIGGVTVGEELTSIVNVQRKFPAGTDIQGEIMVVDDEGRPVEGASVALSCSDSALIITPSSVTTDAEGMALATFRASIDGYYSINSTATKGGKTTTSSTLVTVSTGPPPILYLSADPGKLFLNASESTDIALKVVDGSGDPVQGATITVDTGVLGYGSVNVASIDTNAQGQATITYTAPNLNQSLNKHLEVRLVMSVSKERYLEKSTNTVTQSLVIKNPTASAWHFVTIEDVSRYSCDENHVTASITVKAIYATGGPISGETINIAYTNQDVLQSPPTSVTTDAGGIATASIQFKSGIDTNATRVTFSNTGIPNGVASSVTLLYKGDTTPSTPMYGGMISFDGTPFMDPDAGDCLNMTIKLFDIDGNPPSEDVDTTLLIGQPSAGYVACVDDACLDENQTSFATDWDWTGCNIYTSMDGGALVGSGYIVSSMFNDTEINELNDGFYTCWSDVIGDAWAFYLDEGSIPNYTGVVVQGGEATVSFRSDSLSLADSVPQIIAVPNGKSGFYCAPDYSMYNWQIKGPTTIYSGFAVERTYSIVSAKYDVETPIMRNAGPSSESNVSMIVWDQSNQPVSGADVELYYGSDAGGALDAGTPGATDANGETDSTLTADPDVTNLARGTLYVKASVAGSYPIFGSTQVYNAPMQLYLDISSVSRIETEGGADIQVNATLKDETGTPVQGVLISYATTNGLLNAINGTTDSNGRCSASFHIDVQSGTFEVTEFKASAVETGYVSVSSSKAIVISNPSPEEEEEEEGGLNMMLVIGGIVGAVVVILLVLMLMKKKGSAEPEQGSGGEEKAPEPVEPDEGASAPEGESSAEGPPTE